MTQQTKALIVVDVQNDFLPGGALAVAGGDEIVPVVNTLSSAFETVVLTADWHPAGHVSFASSHAGRAPFEVIELEGTGPQVLWPDHCVAGTAGADFAPGLETTCAAVIVRKGMHAECDSYSGFLEADRKTKTGLAGWLAERGIREVWVCGLATDFCVSWTALDAAAAGLATHVIEEASRAIDADGSLAKARAAWGEVGIDTVTVAQALEAIRG
ncbi:MAG: bifunctional nicotinamidase/pyrazinamidase [Duodenibacillus sp.]